MSKKYKDRFIKKYKNKEEDLKYKETSNKNKEEEIFHIGDTDSQLYLITDKISKAISEIKFKIKNNTQDVDLEDLIKNSLDKVHFDYFDFYKKDIEVLLNIENLGDNLSKEKVDNFVDLLNKDLYNQVSFLALDYIKEDIIYSDSPSLKEQAIKIKSNLNKEKENNEEKYNKIKEENEFQKQLVNQNLIKTKSILSFVNMHLKNGVEKLLYQFSFGELFNQIKQTAYEKRAELEKNINYIKNKKLIKKSTTANSNISTLDLKNNSNSLR